LGGFLKGLGDLLDIVQQLSEEGEGEVSRVRELSSPSGARGMYGFSVRLGIGATPTVERFGNVRVTSQGPVVSEVREPIVDVFDEGDEIVVIAEVPGVEESGIHTELAGDVLSLSATGPKRKYQKETLLPAEVYPASKRLSYLNGYLELRFKKNVKA
jgi:HSP20 family protein